MSSIWAAYCIFRDEESSHAGVDWDRADLLEFLNKAQNRATTA